MMMLAEGSDPLERLLEGGKSCGSNLAESMGGTYGRKCSTKSFEPAVAVLHKDKVETISPKDCALAPMNLRR